ncbi:MAG: M28 family metallopeptidase [Caldilinea sp.]|nr:Zn-dependent exopeptidase M28 [Anaerolineales bacterium]HRA65075.1 M28 family metallopeptidase [Caldilinea sp.]
MGNQAAAAYIESVFRRCGLAVETQEFACPAWEELGAWLCMHDSAIPVAANPYSPSCLVSAPLMPLCTGEELEAADLKGKLAVLYGELVHHPLPPKAKSFKDGANARIVELLEAKQPVAILAVQQRAGEIERLIEDWEFHIPSATVSAQVGAMLLQHAGETARLRIDTRQSRGVTANVVGRLPGLIRQQIVLCAHYDTKVDTPGASDNASGVAVMLALAEQLCRQEQPYSLEFVAFTGQEYLPLGDDEYVRRRGNSFNSIDAVLNFDAVGLRNGPNAVAGFNLPPVMQANLERVTAHFPEVTWMEPWPEGNHSTFAFRGVPSLAFTAKVEDAHYHLRSDTIDQISRERLDEMVMLGGKMVEEMALSLRMPA